MRFIANHHCVTGSDHLKDGKPCQDHALSYSDSGLALAIVSDGCTNGDRTELGSGIYAHATAKAIHEFRAIGGDMLAPPAIPDIMLRQWLKESETRETLGLNKRDMLATCLTACVTPEGGWIHVQGDGVVALVDRDGFITIARFDWTNNMPAYPAYRIDNYAGFIAGQTDRSAENGITPCLWHTDAVGHPGAFSSARQAISMRDGILGHTIAFDASTLSTLKYIGVFTDGVTQVGGVDWMEAVADMFAFKWTGGQFVKARLDRFTLNTRRNGGGPNDDLGAAVIEVQHEPEGESSP